MKRCFTNILTEEVAATATFYVQLLDMEPQFSSDWFVNLVDPDNRGLELGILKQSHDIVPHEARQAPAGVMLTFVVDDCDVIHQRAIDADADIVETPNDMPYGQRRMILRDPAGTLVDISSPV
ncbi:MAG: VOC family protein [Roseibium sp.]|uniref:VOC family protein n=1 Tax=Roseibium sp. TaxID=1936156 RepID=UPI002630A50B|nr:VOC family protein [Roseibium sp.]MCV0424883.1 VOC family protein [Roseibium sp.]